MRKNFMKKVVAGMLTAVMAFSLTACGGGDASTNDTAKEEGSSDVITVGFSQVGAESDWRTANSQSMKDTFSKENGYDLIFDDAQQKQENQITAIRNFIQQEVDYILLAPVTETGWDTVLQEAKDADIPVIIVDRMVDVSDDSLYTTWIGTDSLLEGRKAARPRRDEGDRGGRRPPRSRPHQALRAESLPARHVPHRPHRFRSHLLAVRHGGPCLHRHQLCRQLQHRPLHRHARHWLCSASVYA